MAEAGERETAPERWNAVGAGSNLWMDMSLDPRFTDWKRPESDRATLVEFLRRYRLVMEMKCADLDAAQLGAVADPALVDDAWRAWRGEVAFAEKFVADSPDLGTEGFEPDGSSPALRSVLVHMIEEYARHCGHADLLRERIDGRVGQ